MVLSLSNLLIIMVDAACRVPCESDKSLSAASGIRLVVYWAILKYLL